MEDLNENIDIEDENLNNIESEVGSISDEKETYTKEEYKKLQSDSEKWVQKLIAEKKLIETYVDELAKVWDNPDYLIDLVDDNPKVAQMILDKYYWWEDIEDYKQRIWYQEDYQDPATIQKKIKEEAKKIAETERIETQKDTFIQKLKMTDEEKENFINAFDEIKSLKSFNIKDLQKQFEKAYRLWNDNEETLSKLKTQENIWKSMSIWEGKSWKIEKKDNWNNEINSFLKLHKII